MALNTKRLYGNPCPPPRLSASSAVNQKGFHGSRSVVSVSRILAPASRWLHHDFGSQAGFVGFGIVFHAEMGQFGEKEITQAICGRYGEG